MLQKHVVEGGRVPRLLMPAGQPETATRPARARTDEDRAQDAWKAMDRGEDPTEPSPADQQPGSGPARWVVRWSRDSSLNG